ncbi:MAG: hypothetical protein NT077_02630 [Candidatus Taylorbacteria bacterium]|nr:hypothetical protein [Candidatus Taylorbacteria bacterium]
MKTLMTVVYILFGVLNALFGGLFISIAIKNDWDVANILLSIPFFGTAVLLMRVPFSMRNIESTLVLIVMGAILLTVIEMIMKEGSESELILAAIVIIITALLVAFLDVIRYKLKFGQHQHPIKSPTLWA